VGYGQTENVSVDWQKENGMFDVLIKVNPYHGIVESNYSNNNITSILYVCSKSRVLIVDDSDTEDYSTDEPSSADDIETVLKNNGYCTIVWNESEKGVPSIQYLNQFDVVVWSAGDYWNTVINESDVVLLEQYNGGIIFEGSDIAFDHVNDSFIQNYLHSQLDRDIILDNETEIILGEHEILANISIPNISLNKSLCPYPDSLTPTDGLSVANWSDGGSAIIVYDDSDSRMVYYGFSVDSITDAETMEKLVLNSVEWVAEVAVNEPPTASFTYSPTFPTTADTIQFNDTSTDSDGWIEEWFWDFGDGNYSTLQNPAYQYAESGTYWVTLTVTDNYYATNITSRKLVFSLADDFNDGNADGWYELNCNPNYVANWSVIDGEYVLDAPFGACTPSVAGQECWSDYAVEADIMHTSLSMQRVHLIGRVTDVGCSGAFEHLSAYALHFYYHPDFTDKVDLDLITLGGQWAIATGSFSFEPNVWYHVKMEFNGSKIKCYVNGTKVIETTDNSFSHGRIGFYVWNHGGESHFDNVVVTVYNITNLEPTASFIYTPEFPLASDIINFTDLSTDPDGSIVEWHWDFGDGTNETIAIPPANTSHQYATVGTYTVTLTVTDNEGATNNISKDIIVGVTLAEALDNAELNWTTGGDTKWFGQTETYVYDNDSAQSAPMGNLQSTYIQTEVTGPGNLTFYWKVSSEADYDFLRFFLDGIEQANISSEVDWHQMSYDISDGNHMLKWSYTKDEYVKAGSDCGWLDKVVSVAESNLVAIPKPDHKYNNVGSQYPCTTYLNGSLSYDPDGFIINYTWDFGDGEVGYGEKVEHKYKTYKWVGGSSGHYEPFDVSLTVKDNEGNSATNSTSVNV
jgi:PKD repeat protein